MAQLVMLRPTNATPIEAGAARHSRLADPGIAPQLATLLAAAFPEMVWDEARVRKDLFDAPDVPATFVIEDAGRIVATASVRYHERFPESGYVHWVGADPAYQGKGLGTAVMAAVMLRFAADGRASSILETDDVRLPAIASYLSQGFIPHYTEADHPLRWSKVFEELARRQRRAKGK